MKNLLYLLTLTAFVACTTTESDEPSASDTYLDYSQRDDQWTGGVKVIPVETELGTFNVWTKRVGNNPDLKVLLLHGGPGATHEYFESADSYFPNAEVEYYYYDQLGSGNSDNPEEERLWDLDRFVDEVEQVRKQQAEQAQQTQQAQQAKQAKPSQQSTARQPTSQPASQPAKQRTTSQKSRPDARS